MPDDLIVCASALQEGFQESPPTWELAALEPASAALERADSNTLSSGDSSYVLLNDFDTPSEDSMPPEAQASQLALSEQSTTFGSVAARYLLHLCCNHISWDYKFVNAAKALKKTVKHKAMLAVLKPYLSSIISISNVKWEQVSICRLRPCEKEFMVSSWYLLYHSVAAASDAVSQAANSDFASQAADSVFEVRHVEVMGGWPPNLFFP